MKLINPKAELLLQQPGLEGVYKQIELAGRTCYKSEDKITENSAKPFVDRMIKSNHLAMLEHGTVYLMAIDWDFDPLSHYRYNKYSRYRGEYLEKEKCQGDVSYKYAYYVTTNLRVLVENGWLDDLKYICEPTEYHEKRYTFKLTTSIGVSRESNRHRVHSIAEESTRYCNYSKDKFGGEINITKPFWISEGEYAGIGYDLFKYCYAISQHKDQDEFSDIDYWLFANLADEYSYMNLLRLGWTPQQARIVLPLDTKTELVHTAFASDWKHFFDLRYFGKTGAPHPNMVELAGLMAKEANKYGIWNNIHNIESERTGSDKKI